MISSLEGLRKHQEEDSQKLQEEKIKEQERQAQTTMINQNMQLAQMAMMTQIVKSFTGQNKNSFVIISSSLSLRPRTSSSS